MSGLIIASCALLAYAAATMVCVPFLVSTRRWAIAWPRTAIAIWAMGLGTGVLSILASVVCTIEAAKLLATRRDPSISWANTIGGVGLTITTYLLIAVAGGLGGAAIYRAALGAFERRQIRDTLRTISGVHLPVTLPRSATVIESPEAAATSLAGRNPRIVISSALRDHLSAAELNAVIEHEQAHLTQHHHRLLQMANIQFSCAPALPCARALERSLRLLVELAADDRAARRCGSATLASALRRLNALTSDESYNLRARRLEGRLAVP